MAFVLYWLRSAGFTFGLSLLFIVVFGTFYARPSLSNSRFLPSALALLISPFFIPVTSSATETLLTIGWGIVFFLLLGTKNLVLPRRRDMYRVAHFTIVAALGFLLIGRFGFASQAIMFVALLFVFREFYLTLTEAHRERTTLLAAVEAFIFTEIAWILSFLSVGMFIGAAFLMLFAFIFHDTTLHRMQGVLTKLIIIRNGVIFGVLAVIIVIISVEGTVF